jgi:hypothetical protein
MNDETQHASAPPLRNPTEPPNVDALAAKSIPETVWFGFVGAAKAAFAPIQSLWTARTLWLVAGVIVMGWLIGWRDVRYFGLVAAWTVLGVVVAFHGRRFLVPDVKLSELYDLAKSGNDAAARLACGVLYTQIAIMVILAVAFLYRPASVS